MNSKLWEWKQGNKSLLVVFWVTGHSVLMVCLTYLTNGNVAVYRKWRNGDISWSGSIWDGLSLRFQWSIQVGMEGWLIARHSLNWEYRSRNHLINQIWQMRFHEKIMKVNQDRAGDQRITIYKGWLEECELEGDRVEPEAKGKLVFRKRISLTFCNASYKIRTEK